MSESEIHRFLQIAATFCQLPQLQYQVFIKNIAQYLAVVTIEKKKETGTRPYFSCLPYQAAINTETREACPETKKLQSDSIFRPAILI